MELINTLLNEQYKIIKKIGSGGLSDVWLAKDIVTENKVAVKTLKKESTSNRVEDLIRFKNEAATISNLNFKGIVNIIEIGEYQNSPYLVLEYVDSKNLAEYLDENYVFEMDMIVQIMEKIAETLSYVHSENIIHKDLKPENILIDISDEKCEVKIIDFGLAQVKKFVRDNKKITGTFNYMSPEQTGVLNRNVDERSDLYSLGVIFYQLIAGELPFKADNINSIIHQHIAKLPKKPSKITPGIPKILEKITLKLLEKEPKNRYQTAHGLLNDLKKYQSGQVDFNLGDEDNIKLNYKPDLINREKEISILKTLLQNSLQNKGNCCLILGEAGTGKSRLLKDFKHEATKNETLLIEGKCFKSNKKMPFSPFKDVINNYIKFYKKHSITLQNKISRELRNEFKQIPDVLLNFNPELNQIFKFKINEINTTQKLNDKKYINAVSNFLIKVSEIEKGLVIAIDDIQWSDNASYNLINHFIKKISDSPILLLLTKRTSLLSKSTSSLIDEEKNLSIFKLELTPFGKESLNKLIANLLYDNEFTTISISNFIYKKSGGNPLFSIEILKHLITKQAIAKKGQMWKFTTLDPDSIEIPTSVVKILLKKINKLSDEEIKILSYVAVVGKKIDIDLLFSLEEFEKKKIVDTIDKAINLQIVEKSDDLTKKLSFTHDRIRDALIEKLGIKNKKRLHAKIAENIEKKTEKCDENYYYDLFYHYLNCENYEKTIKYGLISAQKAKEHYAYKDSLHYYTDIFKLLVENDKKDSEIYAVCEEQIANLYLLLDNYEESIELFNKLIKSSNNKLKIAEYESKLSELYYKKGVLIKSEVHGKKTMNLLHAKMPNKHIKFHILKEFLTNHIPIHFYAKQDSTIKKYEILLGLFETLNEQYEFTDVLKYTYSSFKILNINNKKLHEPHKNIINSLTHGNLYLMMDDLKKAKKQYFNALKYSKESDNLEYTIRSYQSLGYVYKWLGNFEESLSFFNNSAKLTEKYNDYKLNTKNLSGIIQNKLYLSDFSLARKYIDNYFKIATEANNNLDLVKVDIYYSKYYIAKGELNHAEYHAKKAIKQSFKIKNPHLKFMAQLNLGIIQLYRNNPVKALEFFKSCLGIIKNNNIIKYYYAIVYPYITEAYICKYQLKNDKDILRKINSSLNKAIKETKNVDIFYPYALRAKAKLYSLKNNLNKANSYFDKSINIFSKLKNEFELAKTYYDYGLYLRKHERNNQASDYLNKAYKIFKKLDSSFYISRLVSLLDIEIKHQPSNQGTYTEQLQYTQKLSSIISLSQNISSILNLDELLDKVLTIGMEVTGAHRGYLVMKDEKNGNLTVKTSKNINELEMLKNNEYSKTVIENVLNNKKSVLITDASEDYRFSESKSVIYNDLKSIICVPLKSGNKITGVCYLDNPLSTSVFAKEDLDILNVIMTQAAISIENAKLYKMATTDRLTKLVNRGHFNYLIEKSVNEAKKTGQDLSLIMFDIDHFKHFNDTYGHQVGDLVLKHLSDLSKNIFRESDTVARFGGEEFMVILPKTDTKSAANAAEKLRRNIEESYLEHNGEKLRITISLGVATYPSHALTFEKLVKASDDALYESKETGRNKVSVFTKENKIVSADKLLNNVKKRNLNENFKSVLRENVEKAESSNFNLSLLFFSVKNLEELVNLYSEHIKDNIYDKLSTEIYSHFRQTDVLLKYKEEKFAFILYKTDESGIEFAANKLKKLLENLEFKYKDNTFKIKTNIGGTAYPEIAGNIEELEKIALKAYQKSKNDVENNILLIKEKKEKQEV